MTPDTPAAFNVLFVCLGNICRSPAAEIVFRKMVRDRDASLIQCDSAATSHYHQGASPDHRMSEVLRTRGYTISGKSRPLETVDFIKFDLILTMDDRVHRDTLRATPTGYEHKVQKYVDYCLDGEVPEIPDPYYGGDNGFETVTNLIERGNKVLLERVLALARS
jgi:protein-tyrosine phosphatase